MYIFVAFRGVPGGIMKYNVSYDIAALALSALCYIYVRISYNDNKESTRQYRILTVLIFIAALLDSITAYTISYANLVPIQLNYVLNSIYFFTTVIASYFLPRYIRYMLDEPDHMILMDTINKVILYIWLALCLTNYFTHWLFYFDEDLNYLHGQFFLFIYILPMYFILLTLLRGIYFRKKLTRKKFISIISFCAIELVISVLQSFFFKYVLLCYFGSALTMFVILYSLETPDYTKLMATMEELEKSKEEALRARAEAEKSTQAKSTFLANMSHEIRTPINGVLGMNEIALNENTDPQIEEYLLNIQNAGESLLSIINDILDFSKIESGKMEIHPREYKLSEVLYSVNNLLLTKAQSKGLSLVIDYQREIPDKLYGDDTRIRQILINTINNGIKYTNEGSVKLYVGFNHHSLDSMDLLLTVSDTGIGISKEDLPKLFYSFRRVDEETNRNIEGTGLGLTVTKELIDLMGGDISVESEYGSGTTFKMCIPQKVIDETPMNGFSSLKTTAKQVTNSALNSGFKAPEASILIVDDNELNRKVMLGLLKNTLLQMDDVDSGFACIDKCRERKYDLIFLDHMMPKMDGIEALKHVRDDIGGKNHDTPVIALTANAIVGAREEYLSLGFNDFLAKPINSGLLYDMLTKYIPATKYEHRVDNVSVSEDESALTERIKKLAPLLDIDAGIKYCANQKNLYLDVVDSFTKDATEEDLVDCFFKLDWKTYGTYAHGIKSASRTIGAKDFSNFAKRMEDACKEERVEIILSNHDSFLEDYKELKENIKKLLT